MVYRQVDIHATVQLDRFERRLVNSEMSNVSDYVRELVIALPRLSREIDDARPEYASLRRLLQQCTKLISLQMCGPLPVLMTFPVLGCHLNLLHRLSIKVDDRSEGLFGHLGQLMPSLQELLVDLNQDYLKAKSVITPAPLIHANIRYLSWTCNAYWRSTMHHKSYQLLAGFRLAPQCRIDLEISDASDAVVEELVPFFTNNTFDNINMTAFRVDLVPLADYLTKARCLELRGYIPSPKFFEGRRIPNVLVLAAAHTRQDESILSLLSSLALRYAEPDPLLILAKLGNLGRLMTTSMNEVEATQANNFEDRLKHYTTLLQSRNICLVDVQDMALNVLPTFGTLDTTVYQLSAAESHSRA
jgi:hypothetical protein